MNANKDIIKFIIKTLKIIRIKPYSIEYGICGNFSQYVADNIIDKIYSEEIHMHFRISLDCAVSEWSKYSEDLMFPIGGYSEYKFHKFEGTLWVGEQRELRLELIDLMIANLELQLEKD